MRQSPRCGSSYLEVMLAMAILALCIIPAARMLPALLASQRNVETRYQLGLIAQEKLETAVLELDADFIERDQGGDLASEGHAGWRYRLVVTIPAAGGGRYATVRSEAWADENGSASADASEPYVRYDTIVANN